LKLKKLIFFVLLMFLPAGCLLAEENKFSVYGALGFAYSPSSIRFNYKDVEGGLLGIGTNGASIGVIKLLRSDSTFAGFGLAYRWTDAIGFHGTVGKSYRWFSWLKFRAELNAEFYTDSFTQAGALVGFESTW
jgi:hypothetical protein